MVAKSEVVLPPAWAPLRYHEPQSRVWKSTARFMAVRAGRGSGKTTVLLRKLVNRQPAKRNHAGPGLFAFAAPTRDQAQRIAWDKLKELVLPQWRSEDPSESKLIIKTIWGTEIHIVGFDKAHRIEGVQWDGVMVDESSDIKPNSVPNSVLPALTAKAGFCWRLGVPKRGGIGGREFKALWDNDEWECHQWASQGIIGEEEAERLKRMLDPKDYQEQVLGMAIDAGGRAYHCYSAQHTVELSTRTEYDPTRVLYIGSDFNVDPMAWVVCHVVDGCLCVIDELFLYDTNTRDTLKELKRRYPHHKAGWVFTGDASSRARKTVATSATPSDYAAIVQCKYFGEDVAVRYPSKNPPIKDRMASVNALLCNAADERRLFINPKCTNLCSDLSTRDLDDMGQPVEAGRYGGHMADAIGYVVHQFFPSQLQLPTETPANADFHSHGQRFNTIG